MNKKLLAVAIGAAMIAGATAATAGEAELYGKIHVSVDSMDNGASGTVASGATDNSGIYVSSNSSRLGIKGSEDLGNGLSAVYQYEMSTDYSNKTLAGDRNAYLGLKGGFGTVMAGRIDTPFKTVGRKNDLFGDTVADTRNLTNDKGNDARVTDVLVYTNTFGAVNVALAYVPEDGTKDSGATSFSLGFKQGPLSLAAAMQTINKGTWIAANNAATPPVAPGPDKDSSAMLITAAYAMGDITVNAMYEQETDGKGFDTKDGDTMGLGATFKSGANKFKLQYTTRSNDVNSGANKDDGTLLALGVDHSLSKMTSVYAIYATMSNDPGADFGLGGSGHDGDKPKAATGKDYSAISVGLVHSF
jgi:predicted porin